MHRRHLDGGQRRREGGAPGGDHHRRGLVGPVDRQLLADVGGGRRGQAGRADQDERLRRQVDVLLVFGGVAGDRLVGQLRQLDPQLRGGEPVGAVADHGPVAPAGGVGPGGGGDLRPGGKHLLQGGGQVAQAGEELVLEAAGTTCAVAALPAPHLLGHGQRQQESRRHLGVEGLGGGDAHLDVAPVGRVEDAVGLLDEIAVAAVGGGGGGAPPRPGPGRGGGGGGGRARLADGDDQRVAHVVVEAEARQLAGRQGGHGDAGGRRQHRVEGGGQDLAGHGGRALADDQHPPVGAAAQRLADRRRERLLPAGHGELAADVGDL